MKQLLWLKLAAMATLLVPGMASAWTDADAETRVWVFDLAGQVHVGVECSLTCERAQSRFLASALS